MCREIDSRIDCMVPLLLSSRASRLMVGREMRSFNMCVSNDFAMNLWMLNMI